MAPVRSSAGERGSASVWRTRQEPESPAERNYWALLGKHRAQIPLETQDYVLRIIAAAAIGENPKLFGFEVAGPLR